MDVVAYLDELQQAALKDEALASKLMATRQESNPLQAFCKSVRNWAIRSMRWISSMQEKNFMQRCAAAQTAAGKTLRN